MRSSWLTWLRNASFWVSSARSCRFASRSCSAARSSSTVFCASWREVSISRWVSSAMSKSSVMPTVEPPVIRPTIAWAEAAPTEPESSRSSRAMTASVGTGRSPARFCAAAISRKRARAGRAPRMRWARLKRSSAARGAADEARGVAAGAEDVDEQSGLQALERARRAEGRDGEEEQGVGAEAPDQRVHQRVEAGQAEERLHPQRRDAPGALGEDLRAHQRAVAETRQEESVEPEQECRRPGPRARRCGSRRASRGHRSGSAGTGRRRRRR